tara:strand:+ start:303 stop:842 length:540 start_codon:yes stop_codon:yes gene_type:complete
MKIKQELIIISDLWGIEKSTWLDYYTKSLENTFNLHFLDSQKLGELNGHTDSETDIHANFIAHGIDNAVKNLIAMEFEKPTILAFSVGGTIAWKAALNGLLVQNLFQLSATRLRYESKKPLGNIHLIYGQNDPYKPGPEWFKNLQLGYVSVKNTGHQVYRNKDVAMVTCERIKDRFSHS